MKEELVIEILGMKPRRVVLPAGVSAAKEIERLLAACQGNGDFLEIISAEGPPVVLRKSSIIMIIPCGEKPTCPKCGSPDYCIVRCPNTPAVGICDTCGTQEVYKHDTSIRAISDL